MVMWSSGRLTCACPGVRRICFGGGSGEASGQWVSQTSPGVAGRFVMTRTCLGEGRMTRLNMHGKNEQNNDDRSLWTITKQTDPILPCRLPLLSTHTLPLTRENILLLTQNSLAYFGITAKFLHNNGVRDWHKIWVRDWHKIYVYCWEKSAKCSHSHTQN